ncbi:MAG: cyclase family protein [Rhodococcus fascians]
MTTSEHAPAHNVERFAELAEKLSNWGRWGPSDQRGTLNFITPASVGRGISAVVSMQPISLALPLDLHGPQDGTGVPGRINPLRTMLGINTPMGGNESARYNDDLVVMPTQAATHWDALSHTSWRGKMYNNTPAESVTSAGAARLGIDTVGPIVTRGVLLDVARSMGVERLEGAFEITADHLTECAERQGVTVSPGDVVLVRTGHITLFHAGDVHGYHRPTPGLGLSTATWFHDHEVSAAATDTIAFELLPSEVPEIVLPLHVLCLVSMGMPQGQNFDLEALAEACASDGRYDFLLDATPLPLTASTGGLINPVALR